MSSPEEELNRRTRMTHLADYINEPSTGNEEEKKSSRRHSEPQKAATETQAIDTEAVYEVHEEK